MAIKYENLYAGIGKILRGNDMKTYLETKGAEVAHRAGTGYSCRVHNTGQRQICNVYADTDEAKADNLQNNTLLKSFK